MSIFTQKKIWLSVVMALTVCMASAQHGMTPFEVEPGTKGALPETPTVAPAQDGQIKCLELYCVGVSYSINGYHYVKADLRWPSSWSMDGLEGLGATSCTLQYRQNGTTNWEKYEDYNARSENGGLITGAGPSLEYPLTDYRIVLHGGQYDGWVSNVVTAKALTMYSGGIKWGDNNWVDYNIVGKEVGSDFTVSVETYKDDDDVAYYNTDDGYYTYQWYRRNPNTWEMTAIQGATKRAYTPVADDAGYELVLDVFGDDVHCSFTLRYNFGKTYVAVQGSIEQFLDDGFVLNTDYILPDPKNDLIMVKAQDWGEDHKNGETMDVTERKPGQYAIRMAKEDYTYRMIDIAGSGYTLAFVYNLGNPEPTYREAQLLTDRYIGQFNVKAQLNGVDVPETTIDVLTKDIDGKETVVASQSFAELGRDMVSFNLYKGTYYLKARKTDAAMETYYPNTLLWSEAEAVSPLIGASQQGQSGGKDSDEQGETGSDEQGGKDSGQEDGNGGEQAGNQEEGIAGQPGQEGGAIEKPGQEGGASTRAHEVEMDDGNGSSIPTFTIAMLAVPAPLTGTGVIEGTVVLSAVAAGTRGEGEAETETCRVYLKAKDAEVVAQTETDANGKFRFENVPFGDYQVLLDVEGRSMKSVQEVAVTEEKPEVAELDYVVTETAICTKEEYVAEIIATTLQISISSAKQLTYCSDKDLDFSGKPELKAYVATGYDKTTGTIWLTRVKDVPANTGFLLMGEKGDYNVPVKESGSNSYYKNLFKGTLTSMTLQATDGDNTNYYLSNGDYGVGFYKVTKEGGVELKPNRAYLSVPTEIPAIGSAGSTETIKVSAAGQVPYYTTNSLDFTTMESQGVKAYTATGYDYGTGTIWLSRVKKVPAETGVLVIAPKGDYDVPTASVASVYGNMFKGSLSASKIYTTETIDDVVCTNYYLSNGTYGVGFYKVTNEGGVSLAANRCYLPIPNKAAGTRGIDAGAAKFSIQNSAEVIGIRIFSNGTTGIHAIENIQKTMEKDVYYNLQGQRVVNLGKGIYIKDGKKVVIK